MKKHDSAECNSHLGDVLGDWPGRQCLVPPVGGHSVMTQTACYWTKNRMIYSYILFDSTILRINVAYQMYFSKVPAGGAPTKRQWWHWGTPGLLLQWASAEGPGRAAYESGTRCSRTRGHPCGEDVQPINTYSCSCSHNYTFWAGLLLTLWKSNTFVMYSSTYSGMEYSAALILRKSSWGTLS